MRTWKEVIAEATAAEINRAGAAALRDERNKAKAAKQEKGKSSYQDYLERQLAFKKEKYEAQKKAQIERIQKSKVEKHTEKAKASLSNIKTQSISDKDKDPTAYAKAIGNVGSAAAGIAGAAVHGTRALLAKRAAEKNAEATKKAQPEKRERQVAGRPPAPPKPATPATGASKPTGPVRPSIGNVTGPASNPKRPTAPAKPTGPVRPSIGNVTGPASNPKRPRNESFSNWREEFIFEVDDKFDKKQKKADIVDVMKGKNKVEINPNESSVKEAVDQTDASQKQQNTQQIQQQQVQTKNQTLLQQKQQALQQKLQQIAKQKISLQKQGKLAVPGTQAEAYKDEEGGMARNELSTTERAVKSLRGKIKSDKQQLPAWVQSKISKAADHIDTVADYMMGETDLEKKKNKLKEEGPVLSVGRGEKLSVEKGGGLTQKGRDKYNRATGSHLQAPVTGDVKPGSKAAKRRKNFCSRSRSWHGERGLAARRRWKC